MSFQVAGIDSLKMIIRSRKRIKVWKVEGRMRWRSNIRNISNLSFGVVETSYISIDTTNTKKTTSTKKSTNIL